MEELGIDQTRPDTTAHTEAAGRQLLRDYLALKDTPCPACGYNLRRLEGRNCPECGRELTLSIGVVGGLNRAWITALVSALFAGGTGLPFLIALLIGFAHGLTLSELTYEPEGVVFLLLMLYSMACMGLTAWLLAMRRTFQRWSSEVQSRCAGTIVVLDCIASFIAFVMIADALG